MRSAPLLILAIFALAGCRDSGTGQQRDPEPVKAEQGAPDEQPAGRLDRSHAGAAAPATSFQDPAGATVTLADFHGKPLLLNLWATWCAPCVTEMPMLDALAKREEGRLQLLAVSQDMNGEAKVDAFFEKNKFTHLQPYVDPQSDLTADLKVEILPTTILYGADGRELWRITGMEEWTGARAAALLNEAFPAR